MPIEVIQFDCNLFGRFHVGDNCVYNTYLLCDLIEANANGRFNKLIVLQIASVIEVVGVELFLRAQRHTIEGVPNFSAKDQQAVKDKQIDKFAVVIDNLKKYKVLDNLDPEIYNELHDLRKFRNKVHIQGVVDIIGVPRAEADIFDEETVVWAIDLGWRVLSYLEKNYARPEAILGYVNPLRLPKIV